MHTHERERERRGGGGGGGGGDGGGGLRETEKHHLHLVVVSMNEWIHRTAPSRGMQSRKQHPVRERGKKGESAGKKNMSVSLTVPSVLAKEKQQQKQKSFPVNTVILEVYI